jgi:hypothetical protein
MDSAATSLLATQRCRGNPRARPSSTPPRAKLETRNSNSETNSNPRMTETALRYGSELLRIFNFGSSGLFRVSRLAFRICTPQGAHCRPPLCQTRINADSHGFEVVIARSEATWQSHVSRGTGHGRRTSTAEDAEECTYPCFMLHERRFTHREPPMNADNRPAKVPGASNCPGRRPAH